MVSKSRQDKIDKCMVQAMFAQLNGSEYVSDSMSACCPLYQINEKGWGMWRYDLIGLQENQTVKVRQALKEHKSDTGSTWWGLEKEEMKQYIIGCLSQKPTTG